MIDKIKALRALAQSSNIHEAAAAARAAERLILEHRIAESELVDRDDTIISIEAYTIGGRLAPWIGSLAAILGRAYSCAPLIQGRHLRVYGTPSDVETYRYQLAFFASEINRITAKERKGRTYAKSFRLGMVDAIRAALAEVRESYGGSDALVHLDDRRNRALAALRGENRTKMRNAGRTNIDPSAFAAGRTAGQGLNTRAQLGAAGGRLLGA